ncbi:hypothetical protein Zmor_023724 [Zophobas morio]|uniref:Uncharacterized protein n=1 Tax=Zophobas morio TaxID=2755281 RepID=A0AA38I0H1_9CUCU|nr:hypothetical protein Zmor_023724 [Zophobas morio]
MNERENREIAEPYTKSEEGLWHNVRKYLREYAEVTGIHGFRYVAEKRSEAEKIIWSLALIFSLGGCMYMISEILNKLRIVQWLLVLRPKIHHCIKSRSLLLPFVQKHNTTRRCSIIIGISFIG